MNTLKNKAGFTLVELIVVIAILAILAGVAVPAYSGYMEKAKEAKDTQLLSAVNTAFAAACVENGVVTTDVTASVDVDDTSKKITGITVEKLKNVEVEASNENDATDAEKTAYGIEESFDDFFAGNGNTALGYYTSFAYSAGNFTGSN